MTSEEIKEQYKRLQQRHSKIRSKLFSREKPNYNTYVRLFGYDLVAYLMELENLIELLIMEREEQ